jgi:hypothetical protein
MSLIILGNPALGPEMKAGTGMEQGEHAWP